MIDTIGANGRTRVNTPARSRETGQTAALNGSFLHMVAQGSQDRFNTLATGGTPEIEAPNTDSYMEHLKSKYGRVTIEKIGRDQASLEKAGGRMSGNDVIIAPNIFEEMAGDPKKAMEYEKKIDYFFHTVIPQGNAICAAKGLVFEPCGVVVHEDGTVTYICGCSDSPERVAEVNRINRERDQKRAEQRKLYLEKAILAANQRKIMWERTVETAALEKTFSNISDLLKMQGVSVHPIAPEASLPAQTKLFLLNS